MKTRTPDSLELSGVFTFLSTVLGNIQLSMRENQIGSLFYYVRSKKNLVLKF